MRFGSLNVVVVCMFLFCSGPAKLLVSLFRVRKLSPMSCEIDEVEFSIACCCVCSREHTVASDVASGTGSGIRRKLFFVE